MEKKVIVSARKCSNVSWMVKTTMLGVLSFILMMLDFSVPLFPVFLKLDMGDIPALIGGFALGPACGVGVQFIRNLLHFIVGRSTTGGVGEISNFVIGSCFVFTAAYIYSKHKSKKFAVISCIAGTLVMTAMGVLSNYYVMLPLFSKVFAPMEVIVGMGTKVNPFIVDKLSLVLYGIVPFNLLKGLVVSLVAMVLYKKISSLLK